MRNRFLSIVGALALSSLNVLAAPNDDAKTHFQAIAGNDAQVVMRAYSENARLVWIGGPLDGVYVGKDAISATWEKFFKNAGLLKHTVSHLQESSYPKGSTVSANVVFEGKMPIEVRYVITYRDGKIVSETWQIDPQHGVAHAK